MLSAVLHAAHTARPLSRTRYSRLLKVRWRGPGPAGCAWGTCLISFGYIFGLHQSPPRSGTVVPFLARAQFRASMCRVVGLNPHTALTRLTFPKAAPLTEAGLLSSSLGSPPLARRGGAERSSAALWLGMLP